MLFYVEEINGSMNFEMRLIGVGMPVLQVTSKLLGNLLSGIEFPQEVRIAEGREHNWTSSPSTL